MSSLHQESEAGTKPPKNRLQNASTCHNNPTFDRGIKVLQGSPLYRVCPPYQYRIYHYLEASLRHFQPKIRTNISKSWPLCKIINRQALMARRFPRHCHSLRIGSKGFRKIQRLSGRPEPWPSLYRRIVPARNLRETKRPSQATRSCILSKGRSKGHHHIVLTEEAHRIVLFATSASSHKLPHQRTCTSIRDRFRTNRWNGTR